MKKKIFAIFACLLLVMSVGCGKKDTAETPDTNPPAEAEALEPMAEDELLQFYSDAAAIYTEISTASFDVDTETSIIKEDSKYYYKIEDERFESYDDFYRYLNQYFTKDLIQNDNLIDEFLFQEGKDGYLYLLAAGRGTNIFYAGHEVGELNISENEITFDVTAYYTVDEPYEGDPFDATFLPSDEFETEVFTFKMVPEDGTWKFDNFHLFY